MISRSLVLCLFLSIGTFCQAQKHFEEGQITTTSGEISKGMINVLKWKSNPESIQFKSNENAAVQIFGTADIRSFSTSGLRYVSANIIIDPVKFDMNSMIVDEEINMEEREVFSEGSR